MCCLKTSSPCGKKVEKKWVDEFFSVIVHSGFPFFSIFLYLMRVGVIPL